MHVCMNTYALAQGAISQAASELASVVSLGPNGFLKQKSKDSAQDLLSAISVIYNRHRKS